MEMQLTIYRNGKQCNEINSTDPANIYKHIAQIYHAKDTKRASKTKIDGITYTYKYKFVGVSL